LIPLNYEDISQIKPNAFLVDTGENYNIRYGVVSVNNTTIIPIENYPAENQSIENFGTGYVVHKDYSNTAVFDSTGTRKTEYSDGSALKYPVWYGHAESVVYNEKKREFIHYEQVNGLLYYRDKKWGLIDSTGVEITPPLYDEANPTIAENIIAQQNNKWGMINNRGKMLLPFEYDEIRLDRASLLSGYNSLAIKSENQYDMTGINLSDYYYFLVKKGSKYGMMSKNLKMILPVEYDKIGLQGYTSTAYNNTVNTNIMVMKDNKWGYANLAGKLITPLKYDEMDGMRYNLTQVKLNNKLGLVNSVGKEIAPCIYESISINSLPLIVVRKSGFYGLIDHKGKIVKQTIYKNIRNDMLNGKVIYRINYQGKMGIVDKTGKQIFPFLYDNVEKVPSNKPSLHFMVSNKTLYGITDSVGKVIVPLLYVHIAIIDNAFGTSKTYYMVTDTKTGIVDDKGKQVIPCLYQRLDVFGNKLIAARKDNHYGLINLTGDSVTAFIYDQLYQRGAGYVFGLNHKYGILNLEGKEIIAPVYDFIPEAFNNVFFVTRDHKIAIIDDTGKPINDELYDSYSICGKETILVEKNHLKGLIDYKGKIIYECKYTFIQCADGKVVEIY